MRIRIDSTNLWYDLKEAVQQQEFLKQKEREYFEWVFSGRRTVDLFGVEGAKWVLERQARRDARSVFNHKSRGTN